MTQQFKFGDRVRNLDGKEFIYLRAECDSCVVVSILGNIHYLRGEFFELVLHPDTARLDWLADPANKIGSVILPTECVEQHLDSMRDAIDAAMRIQAAEAV